MILDNKEIKHIHCLGIGGIGVSALAELLLKKGYHVSGSDLAENNNTARLQAMGAAIQFDHQGNEIAKADAVVYSSAIQSDNRELQIAQQHHLRLVKRGQLLGELMSYYFSLAVCGAHGKTTTSAMLANAFVTAGCDPSFSVGGVLRNFNGPAELGQSKYFIAEADESDASLLFMRPNVAIVTNIDADHLETYHGSFDELKQTYLKFLNQMPSDGVVVACVDDPIVCELLPKISKRIVSYGFAAYADYRLSNYSQHGQCSHATLEVSGQTAKIKLNVPGQHNVLNATAVIAACDIENLDRSRVLGALAEFKGVGRRFDIHGEIAVKGGKALLIEDYGHHPNEIAATLSAVHAGWPASRVVLVFQPHRYSRTRDLLNEFVEILQQADMVVMLDVYAAGEAPIPGVNSQQMISLMSATKANRFFAPTTDDLKQVLKNHLRHNDIVLFQGAGSVGALASSMAERHAVL